MPFSHARIAPSRIRQENGYSVRKYLACAGNDASFIKRIAGITNGKFIYDWESPILHRNITVFTRRSTMNVLEFVPIALAVLAVVARVAMFLPRPSKNAPQAS
jgi:hypothetical protein